MTARSAVAARPRLHVVTGKGGTGKTTVAAALALALATASRRVLLCEVEGRQGIARLFGREPLPYAEERLAPGLSGGMVYALHIDAESALWDYLQLYYRLGRAGRALDRFGVIDFATSIAPGVRDVLLTGKVYEAAKEVRRGGGRRYDAVVLDAPPTGRIGQFLGVTAELGGLARVGPVKQQSDQVMGLLRSPDTAVHFVTLLEEMPVQETLDGIAELTAAGLPLGAVVINQARPASLPDDFDGTADPEEVAADLVRAGVAPTAGLVATLVETGRDYADRRELEREQRARLAQAERPLVELPRLPDGIDATGLLDLAGRLGELVAGTEPAEVTDPRSASEGDR